MDSKKKGGGEVCQRAYTFSLVHENFVVAVSHTISH